MSDNSYICYLAKDSNQATTAKTSEMEILTSLQIAEITGKRHKDVLRAIRTMQGAWEKVNGRKFALVEYIDNKGEKRPYYELTKTECLYIATKFNDEARARLVLRWEELEIEKRNSMPIPKTFSQALMLAAHQQEIIEEQQREIAQQKQIVSAQGELIEVMKPKVSYCDTILSCQSTTIVTSIAQDYGMSASAFNKLLHELGIQYKVGKQWVLYRKYIDKGFVQSSTHTIDNSSTGKCFTLTTWTQKGRLFLYELLKGKSILPLVEQNNQAQTNFTNLNS